MTRTWQKKNEQGHGHGHTRLHKWGHVQLGDIKNTDFVLLRFSIFFLYTIRNDLR